MRSVIFSSLRGENLIPQDGKSCDPYVEMRVGDMVAKTEKITSNHTDPRWTELQQFAFPWDGVSAMPSVEFIVWDFDYIGFDDFIGYARINLHKSMLSTTETKVRLGIRDEGDQKLLNQYGTLGNLYFTLSFADGGHYTGQGSSSAPPAVAVPFNPVAAANQRRLNNMMSEDGGGGGAGGGQSVAKDLFISNRVQRNPAMSAQPADFVVDTITLEGVPVDDGQSVFVVMWSQDEEEWRTHPCVVQRGFAQWTNLQFDIGPALGASNVRFLIVRRDDRGHLRIVTSANVTPHPNTINCQTRLLCVPPATQAVHEQQASWGTLTFHIDSRKGSNGTPFAAFNHAEYQQSSQADILSAPPPPGGMLIRIVEAADLLPLDYNDDPDPFVVVHWNRGRQGVEELFRTQPLKNTKDPHWNEVHMVKQLSKHATTLVFTVFDQDPHGVDFAGCAELDLLQCDPCGSFVFELFSRQEEPDVTAADDAVLRRFGRDSFGTLTVEWNIDVEAHQRLQQRHLGTANPIIDFSLQQQQAGRSAPKAPYQSGGMEQQFYGSNQNTGAPRHHQATSASAAAAPSSDFLHSDYYTHAPGLDSAETGHYSSRGGPAATQNLYVPQSNAYDVSRGDGGISTAPTPDYPHNTNLLRAANARAPVQTYMPSSESHSLPRAYAKNNTTTAFNDAAPPSPALPPSMYQQQQPRGGAQRKPSPQRGGGGRVPPSSLGAHQTPQQQLVLNGGILNLTILSAANIVSRDGGSVCPYVRVLFGGDEKNNCSEGITPAENVVWNFKSEFYLPSFGQLAPPAQRSGGAAGGTLMQQQQQQQQRLQVELCDARTHAVIGIALVDVPMTPTKTRTLVIPMQSPHARQQQHQQQHQQQPLSPQSNRSSRMPPGTVAQQQAVVADLSLMLSVSPVTLPSNLPISAAAMLDITVLGAKNLNTSNKPNRHLHTNPYVTVTVQSKDLGKTEYKSDIVWNSRCPKWYFSIPQRSIAPSDSITVMVWDHDQDDFDEFLGQARFSVGTLVQSPAVLDLPLEGRPDARSSFASSSHDAGLSTSRDGFGFVSVEWAVTQKPLPSDAEATTPYIAEIAILSATHLVPSQHDSAVVQLSIDERGSLSAEPFTRAVSKGNPQWNETFVVRMIGIDTQVRFTVWDDTSRNATFLGECLLRTAALARAKNESESLTLSLRPRQDPRYSRDDLALINSSPHGFGSLRIEARIFTTHEYERRQREALRRSGKRYQLILQVANTADIGPYGCYFVAVQAGGVDRTSQVETGANVRFRNNFNFELHNTTEMVMVSLFTRTDAGRDVLVGDVSFPVKPPSVHNVGPEETWLTLRDNLGLSTRQPGGQAPRLFVRWRTFEDNRPYDPAQSVSDAAAFRVDAPMPSTVEELQRELQRARGEIVSMGQSILRGSDEQGSPEMGRRSPMSRGGARLQQNTSVLQSLNPPRPFNVQVYVPISGQVLTFVGTEDSSVADAIQYCIQQLQVFQTAAIAPHMYSSLQLAFCNEVLRREEKLSRYVTEKDVPCLQVAAAGTSAPATAAYPQQHYSPYSVNRTQAPPAASYLGSLNNSRDAINATSSAPPVSSTLEYQNQRVLQRLQHGESARIDIVSVFLVTSLDLNSNEVSWLVDMCSRSRVSGFCHADNLTPVTQFFLQGDPKDISALLAEVFAYSPLPDLRAEEAFGYIPRIQRGFKCSRTPTDLSTMFLHSAERLNDDSSDVWFVHSQRPRESVGTRYVNERGG